MIIHRLYIKKDSSYFSDTKKEVDFYSNIDLMKYVKRYRIKNYRVVIFQN